MRARAVVVVLALLTAVASAASPNTERILRNTRTALDAVTIVPAYASAQVPEKERQTAANLLRDVDYALKRAGDLERVDAADQGDPAVKELAARVAALQVYRDQLAKNLEASKAAGAALDAQYRAFREAAKPYGKALALFPKESGSAQAAGNLSAEMVTSALAQLAALDKLCTTTFAGIEFNDRLAFQLAIDPVKSCAVAAKRQALATELVRATISHQLTFWLKQLEEAKAKLEPSKGFISAPGDVLGDLLHDPEAGKAALLAPHAPLLAAVSYAIPSGALAPFDKAIEAVWDEVDRLAPMWTFDASHHDAKTEAAGKAELLKRTKGAKVLKTGLLYGKEDIAKNALDIPTERYRTGAILFRTSGKGAAGKWCQYREFTAHWTYKGGGKFESKPTVTLGAVRYQACP